MAGISDIQHIADLAHLSLSPGDEERLGRDLDAILTMISKVQECPTEGVSPFAPHRAANVVARDDPAPSLTVEEALANAPVRDGNYFRVPRG